MKQLTIIAVLILLSTACKKKPEPVDYSACLASGECVYPTEAKKYFAFKVGTWWVYEEETTHERDSNYVTWSTNDLNGVYFKTLIQHTLDEYEVRYFPKTAAEANGCSNSEPISKTCMFVKRSKGKYQDNLGETDALFFRFTLNAYKYTGASGNNGQCNNNKITIQALFQSHSILTNQFQNVVKINDDCCGHEFNQVTNFYYAKNVGLIRKELLDSNQVWNLVDYHIEQ
jgi:hypothetical protein